MCPRPCLVQPSGASQPGARARRSPWRGASLRARRRQTTAISHCPQHHLPRRRRREQLQPRRALQHRPSVRWPNMSTARGCPTRGCGFLHGACEPPCQQTPRSCFVIESAARRGPARRARKRSREHALDASPDGHWCICPLARPARFPTAKPTTKPLPAAALRRQISPPRSRRARHRGATILVDGLLLPALTRKPPPACLCPARNPHPLQVGETAPTPFARVAARRHGESLRLAQ
eukprot:scaffold180_cov134-Isochrysis_galbana.AAC.12